MCTAAISVDPILYADCIRAATDTHIGLNPVRAEDGLRPDAEAVQGLTFREGRSGMPRCNNELKLLALSHLDARLTSAIPLSEKALHNRSSGSV